MDRLPFLRNPSDDDYDMQNDSESDMPSAAESHMPSDVLVKKVGGKSCWFFGMTFVVGEAHIVDNKISPEIVKSIFRARDDYWKSRLSKLQLITFLLQTDRS